MIDSTKPHDVAALATMAVDIQLRVEEDYLSQHTLQKGLNNDITSDQMARMIAGKDLVRSPGGAGGNVVTGIAIRGGKSALIGKIANDNDGRFFAERVCGHGVSFFPSIDPDHPTTSILVMTTPDAERTFAVLRGAGSHIQPEDVDTHAIASAKVCYIDSYIWPAPHGEDVIRHAAAIAKDSGSVLAIALNDVNITREFRSKMLGLISAQPCIIVGDQNELMTLLDTRTLEETYDAVKALGCITAFTHGKHGAYVTDGTHPFVHVPALIVKNVVDTSGAGDQFAAGFLYGLCQGKDPVDSALIGHTWASAVIQHMGAEPQLSGNGPSNSQNHKQNFQLG